MGFGEWVAAEEKRGLTVMARFRLHAFLRRTLGVGLMLLWMGLTPLLPGGTAWADPFALRLDGISTDPDYGFTPDHPVKLGGIPTRDLDARIQAYFTHLLSPDGLPLQWEHFRPCCPFTLVQGEEGMLEVYFVSLPGQRRTRFFIDHYEEGPVLAPVGTFFFRTPEEAAAVQAGRQALARDQIDVAEGFLRAPADAGSPLARYSMGMVQLARQKPPEALPWFLKAAEQGHGPSQRMSGMILLKSAKSGTNAERGMEWLLKAALNRDGEARGRLARERFLGHNAAKDAKESLLWARLAAEQGVVSAQLDLGSALLAGDGVPKNPAEGLGWLALARLGGHPEARDLFDRVSTQVPATVAVSANQFAHAWSGQELPPESVSRLWYKAESGDPDAQLKLAMVLYNGFMVNRAVETALFYALLASEVGTPGAVTLAELIAKDLPPETLQRIRHGVKVWKPS